MLRYILLLPLLVVGLSSPGARSESEEPSIPAPAREVFEKYVARVGAFDLAMTELVSDDARIITVREHPDRPPEEVAMRGAEWKKGMRMVVPAAKARNDKSTFSGVSYALEESRVRVTATRYAHGEGYSSPYSALLAETSPGTWRIVEERTVTRP